jgi:hypothetical protein
MKRAVLFLMASLIGFSCKDDEDAKPKYEFKDQDLSGKIENVAWTYEEGTADANGNTLSIDLFLDQVDPVCELFGFPEGNQVFFTVPNQVGVYELKFDFSGSDNQTVTLFVPEEVLNIICSKGAIEILSISDTEVTGRIDARSDENNYINGNFTVVICN